MVSNKEILDFVKENNYQYKRTYTTRLKRVRKPTSANYRLKLLYVGSYATTESLAKLLEKRFDEEIKAKEFDISLVPSSYYNGTFATSWSINIYRKID